MGPLLYRGKELGMEKAYPVELSGVRKPLNFLGPNAFSSGYSLGRIEKITRPGKFIVSLDNGQQVTAMGSRALKINTRVRVFPPGDFSGKRGEEKEVSRPILNQGIQLDATLPLAFGGTHAQAKLQIFIERKKEGNWIKTAPATYFVFWINTEKQGLLQWSLYLKGRQVALQVYSENKISERSDLKLLASSIEKNLLNRGFSLMGPTVILSRAFRVPEGFQLGLRG